jgi:hypothetical protein
MVDSRRRRDHAEEYRDAKRFSGNGGTGKDRGD